MVRTSLALTDIFGARCEAAETQFKDKRDTREQREIRNTERHPSDSESSRQDNGEVTTEIAGLHAGPAGPMTYLYL
jgi:hypothetical protein